MVTETTIIEQLVGNRGRPGALVAKSQRNDIIFPVKSPHRPAKPLNGLAQDMTSRVVSIECVFIK